MSDRREKMKLVFLDTETTGLNHQQHEIIEIAIVVIEDGVRTLQMEAKIFPKHIQTASNKALEINGYCEEEWAHSAIHWDKNLSLEIRDILKDSMIVGHNPMFDMRFIEAACLRYSVKLPLRPVFDTKCAAYMLGHKRLSMDKIRDNDENMTKEGAHRALKDVEDCIYLFNKCFGK
jgi:DNA polymerase-3 subunit epsilon